MLMDSVVVVDEEEEREKRKMTSTSATLRPSRIISIVEDGVRIRDRSTPASITTVLAASTPASATPIPLTITTTVITQSLLSLVAVIKLPRRAQGA